MLSTLPPPPPLLLLLLLLLPPLLLPPMPPLLPLLPALLRPCDTGAGAIAFGAPPDDSTSTLPSDGCAPPRELGPSEDMVLSSMRYDERARSLNVTGPW